MGTNYYLTKKHNLDDTEQLFGIEQPHIHIGKNSVGWRFIYRCYEGATENHHQWKTAIADALKNGWTLEDEYGTSMVLSEFLERVKASQGGKSTLYGDDYKDQDGWPFSKREFC